MGTDRAKVLQFELLDLPFAPPEGMPDPERAAIAAAALTRMIDEATDSARSVLRPQELKLSGLDRHVYDYFGLDDGDRALVDDAFEHLIPAMQPRASGGVKSIWTRATSSMRAEYARTLSDALSNWTDRAVEASLAALSGEVGVIRVRLAEGAPRAYTEEDRIATGHLLDRLAKAVVLPAEGNFQIMPDLRIAIDDILFLVKPLQLRSWLRSSALADAEEIAAELQRAALASRRAGTLRKALPMIIGDVDDLAAHFPHAGGEALRRDRGRLACQRQGRRTGERQGRSRGPNHPSPSLCPCGPGSRFREGSSRSTSCSGCPCRRTTRSRR